MSQSTPRSGASKFKLLQGFIKQDDPTDVKLDYTTGEAINYAGVGRLYYIDHPQDEAIHYRIVVIIRTNNDSWSCYSFCKHTDKNDCSHHDFVTEHIQIAEHKQGGHTSRSIVPRVALQLHDAEGKQLEVEPKIWINCRQMLDIKHTVRLASLGSIDPASLKVLLKKGRKVFNDTFGDCDKYNKCVSTVNAIRILSR